MDHPSDRREHRRYPAVANRSSLEWFDGAHRRQARACLLNVSQGGALLETPEALPGQMPLWLRLDEPAPTAWIGARLVRSGPGRLAALAFDGPCPYDFLESARLGIALDNLL